MSNGFFIAIEGIDGTGKSTLAKALGNKLASLGHDVVVTHEPGSPDLEPTLRNLFKRPQGPLSADEMAILFTADRILHVEDVIRPALAAGKIVICDRYKLSTQVYQSANGADDELLRPLMAVPPDPDLTIIIDLESGYADEIFDRLSKRGELDAYERDRKKQLAMAESYVSAWLDLPPTHTVRVWATDPTSTQLEQLMRGMLLPFAEPKPRKPQTHLWFQATGKSPATALARLTADMLDAGIVDTNGQQPAIISEPGPMFFAMMAVPLEPNP